MPEIKNTFTQGKMNKDLDERLVPNGQYRHAENVNVTTSDDSGVGTVRNLLGNARVDGGIVPGDECTCIGSIADERTNRLYWFIKCSNRDAIVEYNQTEDVSRFIAIDKYGLSGDPGYEDLESFLNFSGSQITGINIIDDFLFWTDGDSEPKKVNIKDTQHSIGSSLDTEDHSKLYVNGEDKGYMKEEHVTVIKKRPNKAPVFKMNSSVGEAESAIFEKIFPRFAYRYKYKDGEYSAIGPFTSVVFNSQFDTLMNASNAYITDEPYNKAMTNVIKSIDLYDFISPEMPKDVVQVDILYKQENSAVVYSIANIKPEDSAWNEEGSAQFSGIYPNNTSYSGKYTVSTENIHAALPANQMLRPWDNVPRNALAQEIIGNRIVYGNYTQGYDFLEPFSQPGVNAKYILRDDQDFGQGGLRSLKSMRDYQIGVVLGDKYGRETPVFTSEQGGAKVDWTNPSLGKNASNSLMFAAALDTKLPGWADYYKFYIKETSSEYYNLIMDRAYIPSKHSEFENLDDHIWISFASADRNKIMEDDFIIAKKIYNSSDAGQVFSENKHKVLDIKNEAPDAIKYIFSNLGVIDNNSVTDYLSHINPTSLGYDNGSLFPLGSADDEGIYSGDGKRIDQQTDTVRMSRIAWLDIAHANGAPLVQEDAEILTGFLSLLAEGDPKNTFISWENQGNHSKRYKVNSIRIESNNYYILKLSETISQNDADIAKADATDTTLYSSAAVASRHLHRKLKFRVEKREVRPNEDFSGKFFVKIKHDVDLTALDQDSVDSQLFVVSSQKANWLFGTHTDGNNELDGIVNSSFAWNGNDPTAWPYEDITGITGVMNEPDDWSDLISYTNSDGDAVSGFFIDNLYFISSNPSSDFFAKESGEGWSGQYTNYQEYNWNPSIGWNFEESVGGHGLAPRPNPIDLEGADSEVDLARNINGLEGVIVTDEAHSIGPRRWLNSSIHNRFSFDQTYGAPGEVGKYFMHLSFLAPGVDLFTGFSGVTNPTLQGKDSIAKHLQGIWGGGIFTRTPESAIGEPASLSLPPDFQNNSYNYVEFEGNYSDTGEALSSAPSALQGQGYDGDFKTQHEQQWNPAYLDNGQYSESIINFVNKLSTPGSKFRFANDPNGEVYEILSVKTKRIYNHTSWRMRWIWNGDSYIANENSVEEAAIKWANSWQANGNGSFNDITQATLLSNLEDVLEDFGSANNRRTCFILELDKNPLDSTWNPTNNTNGIDLDTASLIEFISEVPPALSTQLLSYPAIWETEPKQQADLNIYYEASGNIPLKIQDEKRELFAPVGCKVEIVDLPGSDLAPVGIPENVYLSSWDEENNGRQFTLDPGFPATDALDEPTNFHEATFKFTRHDGSYTLGRIFEVDVDFGSDEEYRSKFLINTNVDPTENEVGLSWHNCYSFGDGVESNRIRDGFNEMVITNGARASATIETPYSEERRKSGLIYSGIYNSNSGVNNLNQFIQAEKITKDLNPTYGSIQKLFARNTDLVALCEDRVLKVLANKDALFNADGNPQLVASESVLGQAVPFVGDYGISQHPESFASDSYRAYFADKQRGAVLRLSMDGLTPISDAGMRDWFRDNLIDYSLILGSFDGYDKQYNITMRPKPFSNIIENSNLTIGETPDINFNLANIIENGEFGVGGSLQSITALDLLLPNAIISSNDGANGDDPSPLLNMDFAQGATKTDYYETPVGDIYPGKTPNSIHQQGWVYEPAERQLYIETEDFSSGENGGLRMLRWDINASDNSFHGGVFQWNGNAINPPGDTNYGYGGYPGFRAGNINISAAGSTAIFETGNGVGNHEYDRGYIYTQLVEDPLWATYPFTYTSPPDPFYTPSVTPISESALEGGTIAKKGITFRSMFVGNYSPTGTGTKTWSGTASFDFPLQWTDNQPNAPYSAVADQVKDWGSNPKNLPGAWADESQNLWVAQNDLYSTGVDNMTCFAGDEIQVEFDVVANEWGDLHDPGNWGEGDNAYEAARRGFRITLLDGDTIVASDRIANSGFQYTEDMFVPLPGNDSGVDDLFHKGYATTPVVIFPRFEHFNSVGEYDQSINYHTNAENPYTGNKFKDDALDGIPVTHRVAFKFKNTGYPDLDHDAIAVHNLRVRITYISGGSVSGSYDDIDGLWDAVIPRIEIRKRYGLTKPRIRAFDGVDEIPPYPAAAIPAHSEVINHNPEDWSKAGVDSDNVVDLQWGAVQFRGPSNPGSEQNFTASVWNLNEPFTFQNGFSATNYGEPQVTQYSEDKHLPPGWPNNPQIDNGVLPLGALTDWVSGGSGDPEQTNLPAEPLSIRLENTNSADINNPARLQQLDLSNIPGAYFHSNRWYLIDVFIAPPGANDAYEGGPLPHESRGVFLHHILPPEAAFDGQASSSDWHKHGIAIPAAGEGMVDLKLQLSESQVTTEYGEGGYILRGIFKISPNICADTTNLKLCVDNCGVTVNKVVLLDITNDQQSAFAEDWYTHSSNYQIETIIPFQFPAIWKADGQINFNVSGLDGQGTEYSIDTNHKSVSQSWADITDEPPVGTEDGWQLTFKVGDASNLSQAGGINLNTYNDGALRVNVKNDAGLGFSVTNIQQKGFYKITSNFTDNPTTEVYFKESENDEWIISNAESTTVNPNAISGITFNVTSAGFVGSIDNVYFLDTTDYLTDGFIGSWSINGIPVDPGTGFFTSDAIMWDNGVIAFNDVIGQIVGVPGTQQVNSIYISQQIPELISGESYELSTDFTSFNMDIDLMGPQYVFNNSLSVYYFNTEGYGFQKLITPGSNTQTVQMIYFGGPQVLQDGGFLLNTLVIGTHAQNQGVVGINGQLDNITLNRVLSDFTSTTLSFSEDVTGWVSFKSFVPESGLSLSNQYFTMNEGGLYRHNSEDTGRNYFYGIYYPSTITALLNDSPSVVKNFNTINYEGSQARFTEDPYMINQNDTGWQVEEIMTNLQRGVVDEFIKKEGKWFNYIKGAESSALDPDTGELSFQGLGIISNVVV